MTIPRKVLTASRKFQKTRADYYGYIAAVIRSSGGQMKVLQLFENDMQRYAGTARGVLCEYWYETASNNGSDIAESFQGTLPDDEIAILRVAQASGGNAFLVALDDLARVAQLTDRVKSESLSTLMAGMVGLTLAISMMTAFPIFSIGALAKAYEFLPLDFWGPNGKSFFRYSEFIKSNWIYIIFVVAMIVVYVKWTLTNLIGPTREWLDEHIVLYRAIRDLKCAMFLATMATLTRNNGSVVFTLKQSLETFAMSAKSPWLKWRIEQIIDRTDATGAIGVDSFQTGLINKEMFYFLEDMERAKGFDEGFQATGQYVEKVVLSSILKKMTFYRWMLLMAAVLITMYMFSWQFKVIYEMRGAMSSYLASGH